MTEFGSEGKTIFPPVEVGMNVIGGAYINFRPELRPAIRESYRVFDSSGKRVGAVVFVDSQGRLIGMELEPDSPFVRSDSERALGLPPHWADFTE